MAENEESTTAEVSVLDSNNPVQVAIAKMRADLEALRADQMPEGTLVAWTHHASNGIGYQYAAIFANGQFWITGATDTDYGRKMTYDRFIQKLIERGHVIGNLRIASAFEPLELS